MGLILIQKRGVKYVFKGENKHSYFVCALHIFTKQIKMLAGNGHYAP